MTLLYRIGVGLYHFALRLAALLGHRQARAWVDGRKRDWPAVPADGAPVCWMHCASLGEWEQGRPVMAELRRVHPEWTTVLTFFSPSGYERCKDTDAVDHVGYLPPDSPENAARWVRTLNPALAVFVKYEFWFFHLRALRRAGVPTYLLAASFRPEQRFFQARGGWWRALLTTFTGIVTQTETDLELLTERGAYPAARVAIGGDPRMDRTLELAATPFTDPLLEAFAAGAGTVIIAGSVWPEDLQRLHQAWSSLPENVRIVLAPHQLHAKELARTQVQWKALRYTAATPAELEDERVLLLDTIGILSRAYRYGDLAYVGGAFKTGLHNTLEPLAYGLPTLFGPRHHKFPEAAAAIRAGGAVSVATGEALTGELTRLLDPEERRQAAAAQRSLAQANAGAGKRTARQVLSWLAATSLVLLLGLFPGTSVRAQQEVLRSKTIHERLETSLDNAFEKANLLVAISGVEWRTGLAFAAAGVPTGETISLEVNLEPNVNYAFLASADSEAYDLDLFLRGPNGDLLHADREDDGTPILEFRVPSAGSYQVQVHAVSGPAPLTLLALSLLRGGGSSIVEMEYRNLRRAFFGTKPSLRWQLAPAQWALFGFLTNDSGGTTLRGLRPGPGPVAFRTRGTESIRQLDLYLANEDQRVVAETNDQRKQSVLRYTATAGDVFDLRVETLNPRRRGIVLVGVTKE